VSYHFGDTYDVRGKNAIGQQVNYPVSVGQPTALKEMLGAVDQLREYVPADDRQVLDEAVRAINDEPDAGRPPRRSLTTIMGVATAIGEVGAPVIEAVRKVMAAFGM
jgi:hypothetical protein